MPHSLADKRINRGARRGRVTELTFTIGIKMSVVIRRGRRHLMMLICGTTINMMKTSTVDHLKSNKSQNVVPKEQIASLLADHTVNNSVESLEQSRKKKMKTIWMPRNLPVKIDKNTSNLNINRSQMMMMKDIIKKKSERCGDQDRSMIRIKQQVMVAAIDVKNNKEKE